jgi:hypothetical protein
MLIQSQPIFALSVIFDHSIISMKAKYIDQWNNSTQYLLSFNIDRLIYDWWLEYMNLDMTPYRMLLITILF